MPVFSAYLHFNAAFGTLTAEQGGVGAKAFTLRLLCSTRRAFVKRLVYLAGMYVRMYRVNKTWEILLLRLKIPVILHSIEFKILTCTMLKIAFPASRFQNFLGGGHAPRPPLRLAPSALVFNNPA